MSNPRGAAARRHLEADEAGTHHDDGRAGLELPPEPDGVVEGPQRSDAFELVQAGEPAGRSARGDHQTLVGQVVAIGEQHPPGP